MKRMLSILLCLTLLTGVSGFPAAAADSLNVDSYYTLPESVTVDGVTITTDGQLVVTDEKLLQVLGDINANIPDYGTALSVMNGSTVDISGNVIRNISPDTYGYTIEAGSWSSEGARPSYVRVGKNVKGAISAYAGSSVDIQEYAEGGVNAQGAGTSVSIGDYVKGQVSAYDHAIVTAYGDVVNKVKAIEDDYVNYAAAIIAQNGARVTVDGCVSAINSDGSFGMGIDAYSYSWNGEVPEGSRVEVTGDVQGQIRANYGSTVNVQGHAEGSVGASGNGTSVTIGDGVNFESDKLPYYYDNSAVSAYDHAAVSITGDVVSKVKAIEDGYLYLATAIIVQNGATVTVDGDISVTNSDGSLGIGIDAYSYPWNGEVSEGSRVEVTGDVQGQIRANHGSTVNVQGHAEGGVYVSDEETSVMIGDYEKGYIVANESSAVNIKGHAEGGVSASDEGTSVTIADYVEGRINAYNGSTVNIKGHTEGDVSASGESTSVTIGDYVKGEVGAYYHATVSVNGDVTNKAEPYEEGYVRHATAITAQNGGTVTVDGDVSAINFDGSLGTGIDAYSYSWNDEVPDGSHVKVTGDVQGQIRANYGSTVDVQGHAEGGVQASGKNTSVSIGDSLEGRLEVSDHAAVSVIGDVVNKAKSIKDGIISIASGIIARNGATVTVDGDVSAINSDGSLGTAIGAESYPQGDNIPEASHVEVTGDATGNIYANSGSTVDVHGHVDGHVHANGKGTQVTIGDGVSPRIPVSSIMPASYIPTAIYAYNGAEVDVTGDVDGEIYASRGGIVDVTGDAKRISISNPTFFTGEIPDDVNWGSTVRVGGDVANGVFISMYADGTDQSKVTVEGTISSERNAIMLNVQPHIVMDIPQPTYPWQGNYSDDDAYQKAMEKYRQAQTEYNTRQRELLQQARNEMNTAEGVQTVIDHLPQIIVGTLAPEADFVLVNGMMNKDNQKKITEALLSQINYIVNMEGVDTANIAVYGYEELDGYLVAREQQKLTVKCINDNMVIANVSAGRYATIDANSDGSYTITVQRGGDLNLVVTARPKGVSLSMDRLGSSGTNSAYDEAQWGAWLSNLTADYAMRTLTLDLAEILTTDIPYETLRAYLLDYGIDTLIVITENAEYTMSIAEVLALAEDGSTFTFTARDGALELAVNGSVVSTFSVE